MVGYLRRKHERREALDDRVVAIGRMVRRTKEVEVGTRRKGLWIVDMHGGLAFAVISKEVCLTAGSMVGDDTTCIENEAAAYSKDRLGGVGGERWIGLGEGRKTEQRLVDAWVLDDDRPVDQDFARL